MEIILAKTAGFCYGVERAVSQLETLCDDSSPLYTYGPIIHNPQVVQKFQQKGVEIIEDNKAIIPTKGRVVIRSHGTSENENVLLKTNFDQVIDCTCPYVKKIHHIVEKCSRKGQEIIIIGDPDHPEVKGIAGWSHSPVYILKEPEDVDCFSFDENKTYAIVEQTTYSTQKYKRIAKKLQKRPFHGIINETICKATEQRQIEAFELSEKVTKMIVIGGKNSSNTRKLFEICQSQCKDTYYIEAIEDLELNVFDVSDIIGITAGASTPKNIIEEVISNVRNAEF